MCRAPHAHELEEIVTGERLQRLAETTLLPRAIALHRRVARADQPRAIRFHEHRDINDEQLRRLSVSRSLFVYTDALALFQEHVWPRLSSAGYVLVTHNSDHEVGPQQLAWVEEAGESLSHWFTQNLTVEHPKLSPLPIGLANSMWEHGDVEALGEAMRPREPPALVYAQFDTGTHPDRERAWRAVQSAFPGMRAEPREFATYLTELARHRFCICPRGNGIDTHRFWECQYLGVVPVVERSPHTEMWARQGLPMVLLDDWSELSRERLEAEQPVEHQPNPPVLRLSHHAARVRDAAARARPAGL